MASKSFEELVIAVSGTHQGYKQGEPPFQTSGVSPQDIPSTWYWFLMHYFYS